MLRGKQLATVDGSEQQCYWQAWKTHCGFYQDTLGVILTPHILTDWLRTFAVAMQEGQNGNIHQVQVQLVAKALWFVSQELVLDGYPKSRHALPAQHALDLPISHLLKKYRDEDLPAEPKLVIPILPITAIAESYW
jgi:hypothetical protein